MTPLRQSMIRELGLQRKSPHTISAYVIAIKGLASHYNRSPENITLDEVRDFVHHLIVDRHLAVGTVNQKLAAIRFLYVEVLGEKDFDFRIKSKRGGELPQPLTRSEIMSSFGCSRKTERHERADDEGRSGAITDKAAGRNSRLHRDLRQSASAPVAAPPACRSRRR